MRAHVFQHVPFEGLGGIEPWLRAAGAHITFTRFFEAQARLPAQDEVDLLVILGGPMSVNDEAALPWLVPEKRFVRNAIERGTAVLGVCLGAQMIASAVGARVYPHTQKEIGWFPVFSTGPSYRPGQFAFPDALTAFHWHGETFDLPEGAVHLARSAACEQQAFQIGRRVLGLQCHVEFTPESAAAIVSQCRTELVPAPYIQSEADILQADAGTYARCQAVLHEVLEFLTVSCAGS